MKVLSSEDIKDIAFKQKVRKSSSLSSDIKQVMSVINVGEGAFISTMDCKAKKGPRGLVYSLSSDFNKTVEPHERRKFTVKERVGGGWVMVRTK